MKLKFLFCAAAAFLSAGCNDEDGSGDFGNLKFPDTGELDQTFKADQTSSRLTFEVAEAWTSEVVYGDSRADETTGWVSLSPDHGGAGRVTVEIALTPNDTGEERSASIVSAVERIVSRFRSGSRRQAGRTRRPNPIRRLNRNRGDGSWRSIRSPIMGTNPAGSCIMISAVISSTTPRGVLPVS